MNEEFKKFIQEEVKKLHKITLLEEAKKQIEEDLKLIEEGEWPEKLKKGRFNTYCKKQGFKQGASTSCAKKAMDSDDKSVRGMASFYMNTIKPSGKTASDLEEEKWMQKAFKKKEGSLHSALGIPEDEKISVSKMKQALADPKLRKKAQAAINANPDVYGSLKKDNE